MTPDAIPAREEKDWQSVLDAIKNGPQTGDAIAYERRRIQLVLQRELT
jgi:hypothetical protein